MSDEETVKKIDWQNEPGLEPNPWANEENYIDPKIPTATKQIYAWLAANFAKRGSPNQNRCSAATMCVLRRWYSTHGYPAEDLSPQRILTFIDGTMHEAQILYFITQGCVGPGLLYSEVDFGEPCGQMFFDPHTFTFYKQKELRWTITKDFFVTGHADGFGKRNSDGKWELIECKSAGDFGYKEFLEEGPGDYIKQVHAEMSTDLAVERDVKHVRFFYKRKGKCALWDRLYDKDDRIVDLVRKEFLAAAADMQPARPHELVAEMTGRKPNKKPTGRLLAKFPCDYCAHLAICHKGLTKEFVPNWDGMGLKPTWSMTKGA